MKPTINSTEDFKPNFSHKFFFDSNVWFYLLFPQYSKVSSIIISKYSSFFDQILNKGCLIETTVLQISELVNLIHKIEQSNNENHSIRLLKLKDFLKSTDGKSAKEKAQTLVNTMLKSATLRQGNLTESEMLDLMNQISNADFNDLCIAKHCEKESAILVTHDFDFNAVIFNLEIISANSNYF